MNKRFSTLLAAALVAGGFSFNTMAVAAATSTEFVLDATKYYQVHLDQSDASGTPAARLLAIGHSTDGKRDSLVFVTPESIDSYEALTSTMWKVSMEQKVDALGGVYYAMTLTDKDGQAFSVSKKDVKPDQLSFYKAKPAYIVADGISTFNLTKDQVTVNDDDEFVFTAIPEARFAFYNAETGKATQYALVNDDNFNIKVMMAEGVPSAGDVTVEPKDADVMSLYLCPLAYPGKEYDFSTYKLGVNDLSKEANDSFELTFSNDVKNSEIGNLFSEKKLRAESFSAMWSTAVYKTDYAEASAKAQASLKEAFDAIKPAYAAYKAEQKIAIDAAKATAATEAGKLIDKAVNKTDLDGALTDFAAEAHKYLRSLKSPENPALLNKLDSVRYYFELISLTPGAKLAATADDVKAYDAVVKRADKMLADIEAEAKLAFKVVDSVMVVAASNPYQTDADFTATFKPGREADAWAKFASSGVASLQRNFLNKNLGEWVEDEMVAVGDMLMAVGEAAKASVIAGDGKSKNIVAKDADAAGYYALAIVDSLIDGKQAYLRVDTNYVAEKEQYFMFTADTLTTVEAAATRAANEDAVVAGFGKNINLFAFQLEVNTEKITGDEVTINTFKPVAQENNYSEGFDTEAAVVVIRSLANNSHREVSVAANAEDPSFKNSTITFKALEGAKPSFKEGEVYFIKSLKEADARKPYQVLTSTTGDEIVGATTVYNNVPATQWFVSAVNVTEGTYQFTNRDADVTFFGETPVKIIVKEGEDNTYVTANKDTLEITAVEDLEDAFLGYKHITAADMDHRTFKLTATNFANPEAKYYLTMGADSSVVATADADKALELKAKECGWLFDLADANLSAASYGFELYLGNDTLYFRNSEELKDGNDLMLTKLATEDSMMMRRVNDNAAQYELLWNVPEGTGRLESEKIAIDQNGNAVVVAADEITGWAFNLESAVTESYLNIADAPKNVTISLKGDEASKVTAVKPFAVIKRTGLELKAAATDNDFVLGLDTAYVNRPENYRYAYYITKPVDVEKAGSFDTKAYMVSYTDSLKSKSDVKYDQDGLTRIGFVHANRIEAEKSCDTLAIGTNKIDMAEVKGISNATWAFPIDEDNEGYYRIEVAPAANKADKNYVSYLNGVLVLGNKEQAQLFAINDTDLTPTDNEVIATSEVAVIAGEGQVTIVGAQGKKVVITNLLGQTIANTVITSDNATIAAPQGVVVVAIEGEEAVKAIVK